MFHISSHMLLRCISSNMKSSVFAFILLAGVAYSQQCGTPAFAPSQTTSFFDRIVGGTLAVKNSWPWQIHLGVQITLWPGKTITQFGCGGSIISNRWILTAAHCVADNPTASNYIVRVGQHDSSLAESTAKNYKVKRVIVHPSFNMQSSLDGDVALLEIDGAISFTNAVSVVCLPSANSDPAEGTECVATGWGVVGQRDPDMVKSQQAHIGSKILRQVGVRVVSRSTCKLPDYYGGVITDGMVCAGTAGKDACQNDSGGPFVCKNNSGKYELVGVVSWGEGCGAHKKPGVYARVGKYISWISQHTGL